MSTTRGRQEVTLLLFYYSKAPTVDFLHLPNRPNRLCSIAHTITSECVVAVANLFGIFDFSPRTGFAQEYDSSSNSLTISISQLLKVIRAHICIKFAPSDEDKGFK